MHRAFLMVGLCALWIVFLSSVPASAGLNSYPERVKQQYVQECMSQPIPYAVDIPKEGRYKHCLCTFYYIKQNMSYTEYQSFDQTVRSGQMQNVPANYIKIMEDGTTQCARRYLMGVGKIR
jgi:hypothetical protein